MQLYVEVLYIILNYRVGSIDSIFGFVRNLWNYKFVQLGREYDKINDWYIIGGSLGGSVVVVVTGVSFG